METTTTKVTSKLQDFTYNIDTWKILDNFFDTEKKESKYRLNEHHLESYNDFMNCIIPAIIENNNPIKIVKDSGNVYSLIIKDINIRKPMIKNLSGELDNFYPFMARSKNSSYLCDVFVTLEERCTKNGSPIGYTNGENIHNNILLCKIPCMLHSDYCHLKGLSDSELIALGECPYDIGGYFIINGGEKVIVSQERVAENKVYVWPARTTDTKYTHECEIKSSIDQRYNPIKQFRILLEKETASGDGCKIKAKIFGFKTEIPLWFLFKALGFNDDKTILTSILGKDINNTKYVEFISRSIEYTYKREAKKSAKSQQSVEDIYVYTQEDAINYLVSQLNNSYGVIEDARSKLVYDNLYREFLPHCGINLKKKALFLSYMVKKLILCYFDVTKFDDRDNYINKRLNVSGTLCCTIFRSGYINVIKEIKKIIGSKIETIFNNNGKYSNIIKLFTSSIIESKFKYALSTGNWGTNKNKDSVSDKGVAQVLNRIGYYSYLSHIRRVNSPLESSGSKIIQPRKLHMTHYGMCCPNETPEGAQIGVIKNLSMHCKISKYVNDYPIRVILEKIKKNGINLVIRACDVDPCELKHYNMILLNGDLFGYCLSENTKDVYDTLILLRRHNKINIETSISWFIESNEIVIQTDGGRYMRPLYIVNEKEDQSGDQELLVSRIIKELNEECRSGTTYNSDKEQKEQKEKYDNIYNWNNFVISKHRQNKTIQNGISIEYLDTSETENSIIAIDHYSIEKNNEYRKRGKNYLTFTHCEIHSSMMLGVVAQMIPFSNHNQSPRNIYQSSMGKQAIGTYVTSYKSRFDTMSHVLVYGQKPLVQTRTTKWTRLDKLAHGSNAMLAVAIYEGFNQEDAQILNEDSINRGFFNTLFYRSYIDTETKHKNSSSNNEKFMNPDGKANIIEKKISNWDHIDVNGVPILGDYVDDNSAIIGKVIEIKDSDSNTLKYKDVSTIVRNYEFGRIDEVLPTNNTKSVFYGMSNKDSDGNNFISVRVVQLRKPEIGDKFASRHSQKGCCGKLVKAIDMPVSSTGIVPDIIMNPHGFPSRMTEAKVLEILYGKYALCSGQIQDGTVFMKRNLEEIENGLENFGFNKYGNETMYCGKTGRKFKSDIYFGPVYYQRLKHMVLDKMHSRDTGPIQMLTRQPAEGRSRDGGLRIGEMERDCLISHGTQKLLKERFMDCSDGFVQYVDKTTGNIVIGNSSEKIYKKPNSEPLLSSSVGEIQIPYSLDLGFKEMKGMGINIEMELTS
jgi:DNA-directed RNA polymerase II subunit RPB2